MQKDEQKNIQRAVLEPLVQVFISEERLRDIIREEIEAHERRQLANIRARGLPGTYSSDFHEVKIKYGD